MKRNFYSFILLILCISCNNNVYFLVEEEDRNNYMEEDNDSNSSGTVNLENSVLIVFSDEEVSINNPFEKSGVKIVNNNGHIEATSTITSNEISYVLSGTTTNGSLKVYSNYKYTLYLNGVEITNPQGAAINNQCSKKLTVQLVENTTNRLIDGETYNYVSGEDMKGTFFSEGQIHFYGTGSLEITGKNKHGLCVDDYLHIHEGNITVLEAATDAIHVNDYIQIDGGNITTKSVSEGIDCEKGYIEINGGNIDITTTGPKAHGIKSLTTISIDETDINTDDDTIGNEDNEGDPDDPGDYTGIYYPQLRTSTKNTTFSTTNNSSSISIQVSGSASKGLKSGGDLSILKGNIRIITTGNAFYETSDADISSCSGIKCDGNMLIKDGTITISSSGTGGKGINVNGALTIKGGNVEVKTTGGQFVYGRNNTAAKAIKAKGILTIHDGMVTISTSKTEAEGLESKSELYIHGGDIHIEAYDDCINASNHIEITGGNIYCYSASNDGVDSNGTLTISGGMIVSVGAGNPEDGFDCDRNRFSITGGYIVGLGGSTSTPTSTSCTQNSVIYTYSSTPQIIYIESGAGEETLTLKVPRDYNGQATLLFSSPLLKGNTNYTIYTGGSINGGDNFYGLYTNATYTKGSSAVIFTTSSMVTTVGSSSGGGGGGPGRP